MNYILETIKKNNIKIKNSKLTIQYINDYGYERLINCYGEYIKTIKKKVSTMDIINIFRVDNLVANYIAEFILDFEMKLNNKIISTFIEFYSLPSDYVLEPGQYNIAWENIKSKVSGTFLYDINENVKACNLLSKYQNSKSIPLRYLSLSWSFHTLLTFLNIQEDEIKLKIADYYGFGNDYEMFFSVCHSIRKFRNTISHNGMFLASKLNYYRREFNMSLQKFIKERVNIENDINVFKLISMLSILLDQNLEKKITRILKRSHIDSKIIKLVKDYIFLINN